MSAMHTRILDTLGNSLTSTGNALDVVVASSALPTDASTLSEQQTQTTHLSELGSIKTNTSDTAVNTFGISTDTQAIVANTTGLATQTTLSSVDGKLTFGHVEDIPDALQTVIYARHKNPHNDTLGALEITTGHNLCVSVQEIHNVVGQATMALSLPVTIASDQTILPVVVSALPTVGTHANAWSAALTGVLGNSASIDCQYTPHLSIFGSSDGATTFTLYASQDGTNFYNTGEFKTLAGSGDFYFTSTPFAARYARLQSSASVTVTVTIAGKL